MKNSRKKPAPFSEDILLLIATLPAELQGALLEMELDKVLEVIMDLGRVPEARFADSVDVTPRTKQGAFDCSFTGSALADAPRSTL